MSIDTSTKPSTESMTVNEASSKPHVDGVTASYDSGDARPSAPTGKPNEDSIRSVMESMSVEEKTRQRRERVEKWRREKLAKEEAEKNAGAPPVTGETVESSAMDVDDEKRKVWSLEDDDEDDHEADTSAPADKEKKEKTKEKVAEPATTSFPPLRPLGEKKDESDFLSKGFVNKESRSIVFSSTKIKPVSKFATSKNR
ncbi:hypothetical protein BC829DRAFT_219152 [Chytridium lagenaria]|nr:hypothetical protein BC829DRAFT_219152 [Chytridium lagenaria]